MLCDTPQLTTKTLSILTSVLNKCTRKKNIVIRGNNKLHLNKGLTKAIMLRSRLKNKANKTTSVVDITAYKMQGNYVLALIQKSRYNYFDNLSVSKGTKPYCKTSKTHFF